MEAVHWLRGGGRLETVIIDEGRIQKDGIGEKVTTDLAQKMARAQQDTTAWVTGQDRTMIFYMNDCVKDKSINCSDFMFNFLFLLAGVTGLEPATSGVTDQHSNQLSYTPKSNMFSMEDKDSKVKRGLWDT
jgi:hypothetical protein